MSSVGAEYIVNLAYSFVDYRLSLYGQICAEPLRGRVSVPVAEYLALTPALGLLLIGLVMGLVL
jgi:hypothetical protein